MEIINLQLAKYLPEDLTNIINEYIESINYQKVIDELNNLFIILIRVNFYRHHYCIYPRSLRCPCSNIKNYINLKIECPGCFEKFQKLQDYIDNNNLTGQYNFIDIVMKRYTRAYQRRDNLRL